ncbi:HNH endonuclease signature motif containing protein, partial [Egicoccus sp. AB-alg6-2]|uniref:HNH endonuclease signature motif containing protein n=1 Tax=Egicoccus sp. AB-alg6-2 TaxID=3242692 RepID=UPI00359DADF8
SRGNGRVVRARPTMLVVTDIAALVGDSVAARRTRLLWRLPGAPPALTSDAVQRISCDADLQFLLVDGHQVLGISAPTSQIPARVRRAVAARDQGCRFPGCRAPVGWTDLHHVIGRERGGPTTVDNLVALCRRHHMAVTEGRWRLTMTDDATVTVRRGRHTSTSDPPLRRHPIDG